MANKTLWLRLYTEVLDDPKVQRLEPVLFKTWINILLAVKKNGKNGAVPPLTDCAFYLRLSEGETRQRLEDLHAANLLDADGDGYVVHDWNGRQYESDEDSTNAERQRRFRETHSGPLRDPQPYSDVTGRVTDAVTDEVTAGITEKVTEEKKNQKENYTETETEAEGNAREGRYPQPAESGASVREPVIVSELPHFTLASYWYKRFNAVTATTMLPDDRANLGAKKLLETLGGNLDLALKCVDYYFDNWRDLWFACTRASRNAPPESKQCEFRFGSFANPDNFQEILSRLKAVQPAQAAEPRSWSTGLEIRDDDLASPKERTAALDRIKSLSRAKHVEVVQ